MSLNAHRSNSDVCRTLKQVSFCIEWRELHKKVGLIRKFDAFTEDRLCQNQVGVWRVSQ